MKTSSRIRLSGLAAASLMLTACSSMDAGKVDYRSTAQTPAPGLEIPPDLTQLSKETRYTVVNGTASAASSAASQPAQSTPSAAVALSQAGDVKVERSGSQRWLSVQRPPEAIWDTLEQFWRENGFSLSQSDRQLGIMETDWAENRAKLPKDFVQRTLGKLIEWMYDSSERDKFRVRLERNAQGGTDVFMTHRGLVEAPSPENKDLLKWQSRPSDPELEAEFLQRLMVKLGGSPKEAKTQVAASLDRPALKIESLDGQPALSLPDSFDRARRRVNLSLDRTGFTVEDRDRKGGLVYVRYATTKTAEAKSLFKKLFSKQEKVTENLKLRIAISEKDGRSWVRVLDESGQPATPELSNSILDVLSKDLI